MILKEMHLKNFKPFYGEQKLTFAHDTQKNVTVIYGVNGKGKTTLYRALIFCLYGEKKLAQDPKKNEGAEELKMVNQVVLNDAPINTSVESFVEISFSHGGSNFILRRSILALKDEKKAYNEQSGGVFLDTTDDKGNTTREINDDSIKEKINSILDSRVKEYFLFDGEKMDKLTKVSREQKKEIEDGIKNLLNIDRLMIAKEGMSQLLRDLQKQLQENATGDYKKQIHILEEKDSQKRKLEKESREIADELKHAGHMIASYDKALNKYKGKIDILKRRADVTRELDGLKMQMTSFLQDFFVLNDDIGVLIAKNDIEKVKNVINDKRQKGEIPAPFRKELFEKILKDKVCICNTCLKNNTDALNAIKEWMNKAVDTDVESELINVYGEIGATIEFIRSRAEEIEKKIEEYQITNIKIEESNKELNDIDDKIGNDNTEDKDGIVTTNNLRKDALERKGRLTEKAENATAKLEVLNDELASINEKVKKFQKEQGVNDELAKRCDILSEANDSLNNIYEEFTNEIKIEIGKYGTAIFKRLIDKAGAQIFKKIVVEPDYSLELYDLNNKPFLANISAGQRQITSISFIMALAKMAASGDVLEIPLFMDTPFGRLSGEHRDRILLEIPSLTKQWILLATDTEFTKEESDVLKKTGRWGKVYNLEGKRDDYIQIEEKEVSNYVPKRTSAN